MATQAAGFGGPNHIGSLSEQLDAGVRGWMLDLHEHQGGVSLCHGYCFFGEEPLSNALVTLHLFLATHPNEVFTIIFESYVEAEDVANVFATSELTHMLHTQDPNAPWPTLQEMIDSGRRLVVFTDNPSPDVPWQMDVWAHCWENHWSNKVLDDFDCDPNRGDPENALLILNHFLTDPIALEELAQQANTLESLQEHMVQCQTGAGRMPNFITVDFYSIGALLESTDSLNEQP